MKCGLYMCLMQGGAAAAPGETEGGREEPGCHQDPERSENVSGSAASEKMSC